LTKAKIDGIIQRAGGWCEPVLGSNWSTFGGWWWKPRVRTPYDTQWSGRRQRGEDVKRDAAKWVATRNGR